jgi:hypothetical protein
MFHSLASKDFPEIKALVLFDLPNGSTNTGIPINWSLEEIDNLDSLFLTHPLSNTQFLISRLQ